MKIANIQTFNNKIYFKGNKTTDNVIYTPKKEDKDTVVLKNKKEPTKFFQEVIDFVECLFLKDTITYSSSKNKKIKVLTESEVPLKDAVEIANLKKKEFEQAMEILMLGADPDVVKSSATLTEEQAEQAKALLHLGITNKNLIHLASLSKADFDEAMQLYQDGLDEDSLVFYSRSNDAQKTETIKLLEQGELPQKAVIIPQLSFYSELLKQFNEFFDREFSQKTAFNIVTGQTDENTYPDLIERGIDEEFILSLEDLSEEEKQRYDELKALNVNYFLYPEFKELSDSEYKEVIKLLKMGVLPDYAKNIYEIENNIVKNKKYDSYLKKGYKRNSAFSVATLPEDEEKIFKKFLIKHPQIEKYLKEDYFIGITSLQQQKCDELTLSKVIYDNDKRIVICNTLNSKNKFKQYRIEIDKEKNISASIKAGNKSIYAKAEKDGTISEITEYLKDKTGAVTGVLHSKKSNDLIGVMETTYYDIDDFICDNDTNNINQNIENSVKAKGTEISKVTKNSDGSIEYREKHTIRGYTTQRYFKKNQNNTEREYNYKITDIDGKEVMSINNYWKQNPNNTVTNIINGNEYLIEFDDKRKEITITHEDKEEIIPLNHKLAKYPKETLWQIAKTLDVDSLLEIDKNINNWNYCQSMDSSYMNYFKSLYSGKNLNVITHEIGHIKEKRIKENPNYTDLKKSYLKEMKSFENNNTIFEQDLIEYFSQRADVKDAIGIDELIAEANMIFNSYGTEHFNPSLTIRSQIIAKNFPETLSKIAEITGRNSKEPLI